ncbi:hypothetical protein KDN34_08355 [Shewanella yunxiaonensis]|uniref:Uncharacterized protein n=1 Tax=Shewanella yunxiaonensis TaxID=2829809 RepID=A0ABX7YXG5_9GAMM|nr:MULTISPECIES: hypothetical protein [Shewanella]MDF0534416.1 hypothetical protein [Shewanella sp. A32]QUN07394.1 hypothetical protein KDN34_08355 [Shewanella yunxiaonensis]
MSKELDLQSAIAALDEYGYEKKHSTDLEQARNKQQMTRYLKSLDYSIKRMQLLQEAVNELVDEMQHQQLKNEKVQTFKTKVINLSKELDMSYDEVVNYMATLQK